MSKITSGLMEITWRPFNCAPEIVEETVAECWIKAPDKRHHKGYISKAVKNAALNEHKQKLSDLRNFSQTLARWNYFESSSETPQSIVEEKLTLRAALEELSELPETQKVVLVTWMTSESLVEAAKKLKMPYNTCKANYRHAILKLRKRLVDDDKQKQTA